MGEGWIKLHRQLMDKAIWKCSTPEQKVILITILMMANHEAKEWEWQGKKFICQPGQFITSLSSIAKKAGPGISIKQVRTAIEKFKKYGFLANKSTNKNRLITVVNWELYQSQDGEWASKRASRGQAEGKQRATNKNDKNDKNDKNKIIRNFTQNPKLITAINDFMEMRTKVRKPLTDRALELLLKKLSTMADTDEQKIALLEQSIEKSWLSVYPLEDGDKKPKKRNYDEDWGI